MIAMTLPTLTMAALLLQLATALAELSELSAGERLARHATGAEREPLADAAGYMLYLGAWSGCKPGEGPSPPSSGGLTFEPQVGVQTRDVKCQDAYEAIVELSYCLVEGGHVPKTRRSCLLAEDCRMSDWSPWRPEEGVSNPTQIRTRSVISLPQGIGIACGATIERKTTGSGLPASPADLFRWAPGAWGPCRLPEEPPPLPLPVPIVLPSQAAGGRCGGGTQARGVNCVSRLTGAAVSDNFCSTLPSPVMVQRCEIPCPRDCIVGDWSDWGPCEPLSGCPMSPVEQLTTTGYRRRSRRVMVAASEDGAPCGSLTEVQSCSRPACTKWATSQWAPCRPLEPRAPCGPGQRVRRITCTDLLGNEVGEEQCARAGLRPADAEPCQRACPQDCVVSGWSAWTSCTRSCATKHHRPSRMRNRTVIAPPGPEGHPCPPPEQLVQIESCNTHSCAGYSWLALPWQPCSMPIKADMDVAEKNDMDGSDNNTISEIFMQYREVWCVENNDKAVKDAHCSPIKRPETSRRCIPPIAQDCQLSDWSAWSDCPANLGEGASQHRSRWVIGEAIGYGAPCGPLKEKRACPPTASTEMGPKWSHGAWSSCQLPPGTKCGDGGLMTRGVWCSLHHHKVPPSVCMEDMESDMPASSLRCTVDCKTGCQYSEWSAWSKCENECSGDSTRSRKLLGNAACANTLVFEGHPCPCNTVNAQQEGSWSSCIVQEPEPQQSDGFDSISQSKKHKECGVGARYRRLSCQDTSGHRLEPQACRSQAESLEEGGALRGLVRESCYLGCPMDCRMSRWSAWGACVGAACGVGLQTRTRNILVNATGGGRPCGATMQTKVCSSSCEQFAWQSGGWSECRLNSHHRADGCGSGDQYRTVRCREVATGVVVADALCDPLLQPPEKQPCHLPCPGECVVSEWSEWSQCSPECNSHEKRDRTRSLLRGAARDVAQRCPSLLQAQPCMLNRTCFQHAWKSTVWGDCLTLGGSPCGEGLQERKIYCERSDGRQVPSSFCDPATRPAEPTEKFCYVDCPIDCEVSEWSEWDFSECKCGNKAGDDDYIKRTRRIVTQASLSGRACPGELTQRVPCPLVPCYELHKSRFLRCKLDDEFASGAACGFGVSRRNVSCLREPDGAEVPLSKCANQLEALKHSPEEVSCFIDCYDDCRHSPWSHWSSCDTEGVRYRKRVSFKPPGPPCPQGPVFKYEVFEYANCNVSESELNKDMSEWNAYDEPTTSQDQDQDDYYVAHTDDQPEKTYLLFTGRRMSDEHTALAIGIACASLVVMLMVLYLTVRCHKQRTIHKV